MSCPASRLLFFFNDTAPTETYTLSLHDALPICQHVQAPLEHHRDMSTLTQGALSGPARPYAPPGPHPLEKGRDRKSTRLNSSHMSISYAVFCLKKKKKIHEAAIDGRVVAPAQRY